MKLEDFKEESKKMKMSELGVYLIRKIQAMHDSLNSKVSKLAQHRCVSCKSVTTTAGSGIQEFLDSKIKPNMKCTVTLNQEGAIPTTIKTAKCEDGKLVVTFSADPGADHILTYRIYE